ncbi:MAG: proline dehydrogenase family protein [Candidatus Zixiibacteriota bacterium]
MNLRERTVELLPKQAIRLFAGPYVAGNSMEAALAKARELAHAGVAATVDVLGEDAASVGDIEHYIEIYTNLITAIANDARFSKLAERLRPSISLKPSSFAIAPKDQAGLVVNPAAVDWDGCATAVARVVGTAAAHHIRATIDMENHQWTDFTLALHRRLFAQHGRGVGTVLQSRLLRTAADVEALPDGCRIRLCIGIYDEPTNLAVTDVAEMKRRMLPLAQRLLAKGAFLEFATHDVPLIHRFVHEVVIPAGVGPGCFETQTLLGVPRQHLIHKLTTGDYFSGLNGAPGEAAALQNGIVHRLYVPFAEDWDKAIAYSRRRLRHCPSLFWTGFINAPRVLYYSLFSK